jgi:hypothetical protein
MTRIIGKVKEGISWAKRHPLVTLFFLGWFLYFAFLWSNMLVLHPDGLYAGHPYVWADWGLHVALASVVAFKPVRLWFDSYPIFAGAKLTYPSLVNIISGMLMRLGVPMTSAFTFPSFLFSVIALIMLWKFYLITMIREKRVILAISLFLFSGGLGVFILASQQGMLKVVLDPTIVTTQISEQSIETNNLVSSMWVPQRAFLLGLPIGLFILLTLSVHFFGTQSNKKPLVFSGILLGLLPLIHTHTFVIAGLFSLYCFSLTLRKFRLWLWYGIPAVLVTGFSFYFFLLGNVKGSSFLSWHPGWLVSTSLGDWLVFWLKNWGVFGIGAMLGTILVWSHRKEENLLFRLTLFFWGIFALGNLVQFQPQLWDNTKIFAWAYIGLTPSWVFLCTWIQKQKKSYSRLLIYLLIITATLSGGIDLFHNLNFNAKTFQMLSRDQIELATWAREHAKPDAVFMTTEMVDNPIAMISGRSALVGYSGWMLNFGLPYHERLRDVEMFYQQPEKYSAVLEKYQVNYVLIEDRGVSSISAANLTPVFHNGYGTLYETHR